MCPGKDIGCCLDIKRLDQESQDEDGTEFGEGCEK